MQTDPPAKPADPEGGADERRLAAGVEVRLLGSGGFLPTDRRETACALLRDGDCALAIDAGTGIRRLVTDPSLLSGVEQLHVVLTHFHLDHTVGLFCVRDIEPQVTVWGAGEALERIPTEELVRRLLSSPFAPPAFVETFVPIRELDLDGMRLGPFDLRVRVQPRHANPTVALRVGDRVAWCTDTAYDEANVDFATGAQLLCHEAFYASETTDDPGHTAAGEAGQLAAAAGVEQLLLIHINPLLEDESALLRYARAHSPAAEVGHDGAFRYV